MEFRAGKENIKKDNNFQEEREEKIKIIKSQIDKDIEATFNVLKTSKLNKLRKGIKEYAGLLAEALKRNSNKIMMAILVTFPLLLLTMTIFQVKTTDKELIATERVEEVNTIIEVSMNKDNYKLEVDLSTLAVEDNSGNIQIDNVKWIESNMNLDVDNYIINDKKFNVNKELKISSFKINKNYIYIQSLNSNKTASKEIILSYDKTEVSNNESLLENVVQQEFYNNSYILLRESISGGKLAKSSLQEVIDLCGKTVKYSNNQSDILIRLEGLGDLRLSGLQDIIEHPEVTYLESDGIIRIASNNSDYIYISGINNNKIKCNAEDLLTTNNSNVLVHKEFYINEANGYKTIALKTDTSIYVIRVNKNVEGNILSILLEQLNIDYSKLKIDEIQEVISK